MSPIWGRRTEMKPMDILVLLKIFLWPHGKWTIRDIASSIYLGKSSVDRALKRMANVRLYDTASGKVNVKNLQEFIIHGLPYVYPVKYGKKSSGIATAWSAPPLKSEIASGKNEKVIWSCDEGITEGLAMEPLSPSVPKAALNDNRLYEMFALIDAYRAGKAREKELARSIIIERLGNEK